LESIETSLTDGKKVDSVVGSVVGTLGGDVVVIVFPTSDCLLLVFFGCKRGGLLALVVFGVLG